ncbi:hypothetical protein [Rubellicoccus peritrichatus]|uniref:Uncharacterized protein n=1 Tax=Rubellicoccus peritrichatus TaxID=3080537 RepID=A0AAQ3L8G6_9BACT|nr:hypothetical protein [Puniceicoccus sp. CR14]WOO40796.1 hypothetical protein RZN69_19405 [Puniceicoccus sp. CR14]
MHLALNITTVLITQYSIVRKLFKAILSLPDVDGVFYLNDYGKLIAGILPEPFTEDSFKSLTQHIMDFLEAVDANSDQTDEYFLKFHGHALYLRRNRICTLGIFTDEKPDMGRLREASDRFLG